jgi:small ubiquitin-related modifier
MGANTNNESDTDESCMPGLVNIEIRLGNTGFVTKYRVHRSTRLSGYFRAFARSQGKKQEDFVFRFDDLKIDGRTTFHSLKTSSDDTLHLVATGKNVDRALTIAVRDQSGKDTFFNIMESTKMARIFNCYALRTGYDVSALRFIVDGDRIEDHVTPRTLDLEDGDQIDVMLEMVGC